MRRDGREVLLKIEKVEKVEGKGDITFRVLNIHFIRCRFAIEHGTFSQRSDFK
jgi:hypothetical protein